MYKILIIEDEINIAKNIQQILDLSDYKTLIAKDGKEGLSLAKKESPDLILCDIMMPELDGYDVLKKLREDVNSDNIPFIFLTAKSDKPDFRRGMELGADDYLTKPFTPEELLTAIRIRLEKQAKIEAKNRNKLQELSFKIQRSLPHELYTPLNGMIGSATLLNEYADSMTREEIKQMAETLLKSAQKLHKVSEKFVLYTFLELILNNADRLQEFRKKKYQCLIKEILTYLSLTKADKYQRKNDLILNVEEASIKMSEHDFNLVAEELIDNAFKFSKEGEKVTINSHIKNKQLLDLTIVNEGLGMTSKQLQDISIFQQFNQEFYAQQGCGFGLQIVKKIMEIYNSSITMESIVNGQTIISVKIPCSEK